MKLRWNWMLVLLTFVLAAPAVGCGDDDDDELDDHGDHDKGIGKDGGSAGSKADSGSKPSADDDELEVAGMWKTDFMEEPQVISVDGWDGAMVVEFDNDENVAYTHYPADDMFSPNKYSKLIWTEPTDKGFYYCTVDLGLDSLAAAKASKKTADADNPEEMGSCGGFTWTKLEPL